MKKLIAFMFLYGSFVFQGFSQSMSNTDNVITLTNTCFNGGVSNGTYNLDLSYYDLDATTSIPVTISGVTVAVSNGVMTITAPSGSFPSTATRGWSLPDAYPGHIQLTSGSFVTYMTFFLNPDGVTDGFNCVPLPVDYNSFTGFASGGQVTLNWQTGLEQNSTVFEIYRSSTGSNYYKIGQVPATGNSSIPVNYSFIDAHPCASNTYYLKMLNSQGTLPISSSYLPVGCSGCTCSLPAPVFCNFTINGPDHVCNLETPTVYTLSSAVPNYSSIAWSVDQPSAVYLRTYADVDRAKATLLKKNTAAGVTLRATLSGCTNIITRYIALGTPDPTISTNLSCPELYGYAGNSPGATNYQWHVVDATTFTETITNTANYNWSAYIGGGHSWNIGFQYTNACGNSIPAVAYGFVCTSGGGGGHKIKLSPNPSSGVVTIGLAPDPAPGVSPDGGVTKSTSGNIDPIYLAPPVASGTTTTTADVRAQSRTTVNSMTMDNKPKIYQVQVVDAQGVVRKTVDYPGGAENVSVNLSGLINGIYTVRVFDNKTWTSSQVVLTK